MTIRAARPDDLAGILAIEDEAFATDRLTARKLRRLLAHGNCALLVATTRGRVVGYALVLFRRRARRARLYGIAVASGQRGRGLGTRLLAAVESEARRRRCETIGLETAPDNEAAVNLYQKNGYVRVARLGPYYEDGTPADRYVKTAASAVSAGFLLAPCGAGWFKSPPRAAWTGTDPGAARDPVSGPDRAATFDKGDANMPQKKKPARGAKKPAPKAKKPAPKKAAAKKPAPKAKKAPAKKPAPPAPRGHEEEE